MIRERRDSRCLRFGTWWRQVPLLGALLPRHAVWFGGLVLYGGANGFYAMSLLYAPLSLLAGVFTTLLVFNLGETIKKRGRGERNKV